MKKQFILVAAGLCLVATLFFFGKTTSVKKETGMAKTVNIEEKSFDIQSFISAEKAKLSAENAVLISKMENGISRGDVAAQQVKANQALADFWKDSAKSFEAYAFYISEAAKLDNSEKNLTFAARLFLENLRGETDEAKLEWETAEAISLFEKAIEVNPNNDDLKTGLGSCYIYGRGRSGNPQETMEGIKVLIEVARRDPANMKAQMLLGVGGMVSGQYDKALERFKTVVAAEPGNAEAVAYLADVYAAKGQKEEAILWYNKSKRMINDPHYSQEADERIKALK